MSGLDEVRTLPRLGARRADGHKGSYGTVAIVAGRDGMLGAAILCARAALRGGAGLVRVALEDAVSRAALTAAVPGAMTVDRARDPADWVAGASVLAVGPGLGDDRQAEAALDGVAEAIARTDGLRAVVVDADALNILARRHGLAWPGTVPAVFTPHPGEAARLLGCSGSSAVQSARRAAIEELVGKTGAVCVLKGAATLVCDGRRMFENTTGNPGLGTGGSGDVLTGLIAALIAQGMEPFEAACLGVHVHGAAGDRVARERSMAGLVAEDLPDAISRELQQHES